MNERIYREVTPEREELHAEEEQLSAEDRKTVLRLQQGLSLLERVEPTYTPPLSRFETQLTEAKRKLRTRLLRELAVLWGAGLVLLSGLFQVLYHSPAAFLVLQAAAAASPLLLLLRAGAKGGGARHDTR